GRPGNCETAKGSRDMADDTGAVKGAVRLTLRVEGLAAGLAGLWAFAATGQSWWLFAVLLLAPDLAFLGYLAGPRIGAVVYNALHSTLGPLALAAIGLWIDSGLVLAVAATWLT